MKFKIASIIFFLALSLAATAQIIEVALANPLPAPMIEVTSPQNNKIYPSNSVQLNFTALPTSGYNFTSFSYNLDGQAQQPTGGNTLLSGLASGSHILKIYGNRTYQNSTRLQNDMLLQIVYFSTDYWTAWVVFTAMFAAVMVLTSFIFYANRVSLARKLRAKKNGRFWIGLILVIFFGGVVLGSSIWHSASDYFFPYYPHGLVVSTIPDFIFGLIFTSVGLLMMAKGTAQQSATEEETTE
jgi:hypothetical protein